MHWLCVPILEKIQKIKEKERKKDREYVCKCKVASQAMGHATQATSHATQATSHAAQTVRHIGQAMKM